MTPGRIDRALASSWGGVLLAAAIALPAGYHLVPFAKVRSHRKSCVVGTVTYVRHQVLDQDWHVTLDDGKKHLLVVEIIPELPLPPAKKGQRVLACGIAGRDDHHAWDELHPLTHPFEVVR